MPLGQEGSILKSPSGELCEVILSNINFARYQEIPESRLHLFQFFSHPTVMISGGDETSEELETLTEKHRRLNRPLDFMVRNFY